MNLFVPRRLLPLVLAFIQCAGLLGTLGAAENDSARFIAADDELNRVFKEKKKRVAATVWPLLVTAEQKWLDFYVKETAFATEVLGENRDTVRVRLVNLRSAKLSAAPPAGFLSRDKLDPETRLQTAFDRLRAVLKPADFARLLAAQHAWLDFRTAECVFRAQPELPFAGPVPSVIAGATPAQTAASLALERAQLLEEYLRPVAGSGGALATLAVTQLEPVSGFNAKLGPGGAFLDRSKKPTTTFNRHLATNRGASVSPTGQLLFQGGKLYDLRTGLHLAGEADGGDNSALSFSGRPARTLGKSLAFTPDDELAIGFSETGGNGTAIKVLDLPHGEVLYTLSLPLVAEGPEAAAVSADKQYAAVATRQALIVWNARTGGNVRRLKFPAFIDEATFSPDGTTLTTRQRTLSDVRLTRWEVATGKLRSDVHLPLHPDEFILTGGSRVVGCWLTPEYPWQARAKGKWNVEQWDLETGRSLGPVMPVDETPHSVNSSSSDFRAPWVLSPGGRWLASAPAGDKGPIIVYDLDDRKEVARCNVVAPGVCDELPAELTFSPDEQFLVGSVDARGFGHNLYPEAMPYDKVVLWDWRRGGQVAQTVDSRYLAASSVAFSPDGADMLVGYESGAVRVFDNATNRLARTFELGSKSHFEQPTEEGFAGVDTLEVSADKRWLLAEYPEEFVNLRYGTSQVSVLDYRTGERVFAETQDLTCERRIARDNRHLVIGQFHGMGGNHGRWDGSAEMVRVFDLETRRLQHWINGPMVADVSADGRWLATARRDGRVELWDMATGRLLDRVQVAHPFLSRDDFMVYHNSLRFSGAGGLLAASVHDRLYLWHCEGGKLVADTALAAAFNERGYQTAYNETTHTAISDYNDRFVHAAEYLFAQGVQDGKRFWDLWSLADGKLVRSEREPSGPVSGLGGTYTVTTDAAENRLYLSVQSAEFRATDALTVLTFPPAGTKGDVTQERVVGPFGGLKTVSGHHFALAGHRAAYVENEAVVCTDTTKAAPVAVLHSFYPAGEAFVTPDNLYAASRDVLRRLGGQYQGRVFPFEQFDLRLNRPDVLAERFGASAEDVAVLRQARERRLRRMGVSENMLGDDWHLPEVSIDRARIPLDTQEGQVDFDVRASDGRYALDRLNVFVNDVPLYGEAGLVLTPDGQTTGAPLTQRITVPLARGANKIQVSAVNAQRSESLRETVTVFCEKGPGSGKRTLAVVTIGVSKYLDPAHPLVYADKDAKDIAKYFEAHHPGFDEVRTLPLLNGDATREGLERARTFLRETGPDDRALVFVAGHGLLDAKDEYYFGTVDVDFAHPETRGASYEALNGLLDGIPAREKLLMMDTCHAGELEKDEPILLAAADARSNQRGVRRVGVGSGGGRTRSAGTGPLIPSRPLTREALGEWFADLRRGTGATIIASSGGAEYANEDPEWDNGAFTYCVLNGLKSGAADLDGDGQIRVAELRDYVAREVRQLTGGEQSPVARRENLELNFVVADDPKRPPGKPKEAVIAGVTLGSDTSWQELADAFVHAYAGGAADELVSLCGSDEETAGGPRFDRAAWRRKLDAEFAAWPERHIEMAGPPRADPGKGDTPFDVTLRLRCQLRNGAQTADEPRNVRLTLRPGAGRGVFLTDVQVTGDASGGGR